jgi:transcription antitermination factor NusG
LNSVDSEPKTIAAARATWHVLWTKSHFEQVVHDQLASKGFELFLPTVKVWSRQAGQRRRIARPMFHGYLFIRHTVDKESYAEIVKARGLVRILGSRWDRLAAVPEEEIDAIRRVVRQDVPVLPHPYLSEGQRVRIRSGPLTGMEGILVRFNASKGLLVLTVELLHRSVAVALDCTEVLPA